MPPHGYMLQRRPRRRGDARHQPSISNEAGKQRGGERAVVRQRLQNANRELLHTPPSRRGFLQVRRSYIGPSSSDTRVSTRTRPSSKAHPGPPVGREPATALPPPLRHPRPPPTPLYFHKPVQQQTSPRGRGGADFLFLLLPSHRASWLFKDDTHGAAAAIIFLSLCLWRKPATTPTTTTTIYYIATNTTGDVYFFSFFCIPPPLRLCGGTGWWWCRLPCLDRRV